MANETQKLSKEELQEDRGIHKSEAAELKRQIGY